MKGLSRFKSIITAASDQIRLQRYFCKATPKESYGIKNQKRTEEFIDLVVIAFNRPDLIKLQHQFLQKNFINPFTYSVADNSNDLKAKEEIRAYCCNNQIPYLCLPTNPFRSPRFSESHGAALNYTYRRYLKSRPSSIIGFLDHDIFPIEPFDLSKIMAKQPIYGMLQEYTNPALPNGKLYYIWPGLSFFKRKALEGINMDFMPKYKGDTGSASFYDLYHPILKDKERTKTYLFANEERISMWEGNDFQSDMYALVGEKWLHIANAGGWKKTNKESLKAERMDQLLKSLLSK